MTVSEYIQNCRDNGAGFCVPRITCEDGFSMSVQASETHYCTPRFNTGPWTHVEVGYPSAHETLLMAYAENPDRPTGTVYGYVPLEVVADVVRKHGGIKP